MSELTAGQSLWFVTDRFSRNVADGSEVTVIKVGRKWAELSNGHRIDLTTFRADGKGYNSSGQAWLSRETYDATRERDVCWANLLASLRNQFSTPDHLSAADIKAISDKIAPRTALVQEEGR